MSTRYVIEAGSELWPKSLDELQVPPRRLYLLGDPSALSVPAVAVIGARRATSYGLAIAELSGRVAAECGVAVVSGAAMGCDSAASRAALEAGGTSVLAVGTGPDICYPKSSRDIYERTIATGGAVISVCPWGTPPQKFAFVQRNALIAALSQALIVTEAGLRSGTMITAHDAVELGRPVFAIPGSIFSPNSSGTNRLIADGAQIISDERELELAISLQFGAARLVADGIPQQLGDIASALIASPSRPQELAERLNRDVLDVLKRLSEFELKGAVYRLPDVRFAPTKELLLARDRIAMLS